MNADGSNPTALTAADLYGLSPVFSPDGTKIAFGGASIGAVQIWTMNADGSGAIQLTASSSYDSSQPDWGPRPMAAVKLDELALYVESLGSGSSLLQKVQSAQAAFDRDTYNTTCNKVSAITNEALSESGTTLTIAQANEVISRDSVIQTLLACN